MKKLLVIGLGFLIAVSLSSCTSSDANKDNAQNAASSDENMPLDSGGELNSAAVDGVPADGTAVAPGDAQASAGLDDVPLDGNLDAAKNAAPPMDGALDLGDPDNEFPSDVAKSQKEGLGPTDDKLFAENGAPPADPGAPPDVTATPQDAGAAAALEPTGTPTEGAMAEASTPVVLPYEKIKTEPFEKKGALLNRVYLAREKDTAKGISEKIYGNASRVKDLKAWNPGLKNHAPRVGDKIYYSSPKDPQDNTKMLVFYEEMGVGAQSYMTQPGDDIRKVSKKLLGHKDSWKEIYATNLALENKMGKAPEGMELRYWPSMNEATTVPPVAVNPSGGGLPPDAMTNTDPNVAIGTTGQPPQQVAPPPPMVEPPPPPPPMVEPVAQGSPPIEKQVKKPASPAQSLDATADPDQTMMMLAGGLLIVAAMAAFVVIRRQRAKRIDLSQQTQV